MAKYAALGIDPNVYVLGYLLDEEPVGEVGPSDSSLTDMSIPYGEPLPDSDNLFDRNFGRKRTFRFKMLSNFENVVNNGDDTLGAILKIFYSGSAMRVYRNWPGNLDPFDEQDNPDGYTDIVPLDVTGSKQMPWGDIQMRRTEFVAEGVEE